MLRRLTVSQIVVLSLLLPFAHWITFVLGGGPWRYWKEAVLALTLLCAAGAWLADGARLSRRPRSIWLLLFPFVVLLLWATGLALGYDPYLTTYGGYVWTFYLAVAPVIAWGVRDERTATFTIRAIGLGAGVIGALAVLDWMGEWGRALQLDEERPLLFTPYIGSGYRAYLGADSPMELGSFLGLAAAGLFGVRLWPGFLTRRREFDPFDFVAWLGALGGLALTWSRGPLVITIAAHGIIVLGTMWRAGGFQRARLAIVGGLVLLVAVGLAAAAPLVSRTPVGAYVGSVTEWQTDPGNAVRVIRWFDAFQRFLESPLAGAGLGQASTRLQVYRMDVLGSEYTQTESVFLSLAVEGGLLLLGAFATLMAGAVYSAHASQASRFLSWTLTAVLVAASMEMAINPMLDFRSTTVLLWIHVGLCAAIRGRCFSTIRDAHARSAG